MTSIHQAPRRHPNAHDRRCSEFGCKSKVHARGVCQSHYNKFYHQKALRRGGGGVRHEGLVRVGVRGWGAI